MTYQLVLENPVPIWIVEHSHKPSFSDPPVRELYEVLREEPRMAGKGNWIAFRGVPIDRLAAVLTTGVDVQPTDAPIWCDDIEKANEYGRSLFGDQTRVVFALRGRLLEKTFQTLPLDATPSEIAAVRQVYPHLYEEPNCLHFSRIKDQRNLAYEASAYWIPGNAKDALLAVFVFGEIKAIAEALDASLGVN